MNYAQASAIGDIGERRVGDVLRSEAPSLGYTLINNVLLVDDQTTSQLDHVLVDRFGILVIETKNYHALIKGTSDDKFWTACYSGKQRRRDKFLNPLRQNDRHREMLHRVLGAYGTNLPPGYIQSLVVFAGGKIDALNVGDVDSMRVIPDHEVVAYLRARCGDFPPNPGALDAGQVSELVSRVHAANQANNPDVIALHAENVGRATRRFGDRFRGGRPAPSHSTPSSPYSAPTIYHRGMRYPDGSHHAPARKAPSAWERIFRELLAMAVLVVLGWWLLFGGGAVVLTRFATLVASFATASMAQQAPPAAPAAGPIASPTAIAYDVNLALARLRDADIDTYKRLSNPSTPAMSRTNGLPTYTWQYVRKTSHDAATVGQISVTLDANGQIVGVNSGM